MRLVSGIFLLGCAGLCVIGGNFALVEFFNAGNSALLAIGIAMCVSGGSSLAVAFNLLRD